MKKQAKSEWPIGIKSGSAVVKIYRTQKAGGYESYCTIFYKGHERKTRFFKDLESAKSTAKAIAKEIAQGQQISLELTAPERLAVQRALQLLSPGTLPIDMVVGHYVEAHRQLRDSGVDLMEAVRFFLRRHSGVVQKTVPDAAAELIAQIEAEQKNTMNGTRRKDAWCKLLKAHLVGKLARDIQCNVSDVSSALLETWLVGLQASERTRCNVRDCVAFFLKWAKGRNYLPKDADPLAHVQKFRKRKRGAIKVITPDELTKLFHSAWSDIIPYLALRSFAGLRDSEARALCWEHIDLESGWVDIPEHIAKQADDDEGVARMVKIRPSLAEWLRGNARKAGPICPYSNSVKQLLKLAKVAGVKIPRNALRHSFISAAVTLSSDLNAVAVEAGHSPTVIRQHYWRKMRPEQANAWFAVTPQIARLARGSVPAKIPIAA